MGATASKQKDPAPLLQPSMEGDLDAIKRLVGEHIASYTKSSSTSSASDPIDPELRAYADLTDGQGNAAVHGASFGGHLSALQFLAETCGADLNKRNGLGCTPLWLAAGYGHDDVLSYLIERTVRQVAVLLLSPQDVLLSENGSGDTPLLAAASRGHVDCCRILLEAVDGCQNASGGDALRRTNQAGDSPLHVAAGAGHDGELLDLFLRYDEKAAEGEAAEAKNNSVLNLKNGRGLTPLLVACERNHASIAKTLLERGALPLPDKNGATPLAVAAFCGCEDVVSALLGMDAGRELLDVPDEAGGCTPLWLAARTGNARMVRLLLDAGADATVRNGEGLTPEEAAAKYEKKAVMELFGYDIREVRGDGDGMGLAAKDTN